MRETVVYIHGKGGNASEAAHYAPLFPDREVLGLEYRSGTPWETGRQIHAAIEAIRAQSDGILLIANSIGAYYSLHADLNRLVQQAFWISPIVDMETLIGNMMRQENVTEAQLQRCGTIPTAFGEPLSWEVLCYVRTHPVDWRVPTHILYGGCDALTSPETIGRFARTHHASLTVMENGEHWFHTAEQMQFLDTWLQNKLQERDHT